MNNHSQTQTDNLLSLLKETTDEDFFLLDLETERVFFSFPVHESCLLSPSPAEGYSIQDIQSVLYEKDLLPFTEKLNQLLHGDQRAFQGEYRFLNREGHPIWTSIRGKQLPDSQGGPAKLLGRITQSLSSLKVDSLTGLPNAEMLTEDIEQCLSGEASGYLMILGIDNFKNINVRFGRNIGNQVLKQITKTLLDTVDAALPLYRLDSDRFAINLTGYVKSQVEILFSNIQEALISLDFSISQEDQTALVPFPHCTLSAGASYYSSTWRQSSSQLILYAENALDRAKHFGKNNLLFFSAEDFEKYVNSVDLQDEMRLSIENDFSGFFLCYQPQIHSQSYEIFGAEALLRYHSPTRGLVSPEEFIPLLEQTDLICPVGQWVLQNALSQCREWREFVPHFSISVNVSYIQLQKKDISETVLELLAQSELPGNALTLEITESMQLENYEYYNQIFGQWKQAGIRISIDDFGTGYSSLSYLKRLEIDEAKIDRCFINRIHHNPYNYRLLGNIIELAHSAKIQVCCEGVESVDELQALSELQPDVLQGFLFAEPYEKAPFEEIYLKRHVLPHRKPGEPLAEPAAEELASGRSMELEQYHPEEIIKNTNLGLWRIHLDESSGRKEMYVDPIMAELLGLSGPLSPEECYRHWYSRINDGYYHYVNLSIENMIQTRRIVELEYTWNHPEKGEVVVRLLGVRIDDYDGMICLEGYHRTISDMERPRFLSGGAAEMFEYNERKQSIYFHTGRSLLYGEEKRENSFPDCWIAAEMVHPHFVETFRATFTHVSEKEDIHGFELLLKTKAGSYEWFRLKTRHIGQGQQDQDTIVVLIDPADHERAMELEYLRQTDFYEAMLSETIAYAEVDLESGYFKASGGLWKSYEAECRKYGKTFSEVMQQHVREVVPEEYSEQYCQLLHTENMLSMYQDGESTRKFSFQRKVSDEYRWMKLVVHIFKEHFSKNMYALLYLEDIDIEKKEELAREHAASRDPLTNVLNRTAFENNVICYMEEEEHPSGALVVVDLDHFKSINDTYGHPEGDAALKRLTQILLATFRRHDIIGRLGGDEFLVFIKDITDRSTLAKRMDELYRSLQASEGIPFTCSAGITLISGDNFSYEESLKQADVALYQSKVKGRNVYSYFEDL